MTGRCSCLIGRTIRSAPDQKEAEKLAFDSSPDAAVATWKSPVLLIQGDDDRNVPFGQTVDLVQRLREQHVQVRGADFSGRNTRVPDVEELVQGLRGHGGFF